MRKDKLLFATLPFLAILLDVSFNLASQLGDSPTIICLFLAAWMVSWWILDVLPLGITALIPLFYLPMSQISSINEVSVSYASPVIFLFLGGFVIARALEKTGLDERIALSILFITGRSDKGIVTGFVIGTAGLSMWISNTATAVMMVPIAFSVTQFLRDNLEGTSLKTLPAMQVVLFLSIAYAANIGGIMTPIGTPPNVVFMGYLEEMYGRNIDFWLWFVAMAPVALLLLTTMIWVLRKLYPFDVPVPTTFHSFIKERLKVQGPLRGDQKITVFVFALAASLWIFKGLINYLLRFDFLNDTSIAILAGVLLFLIPHSIYGWQPVLDKKDISYLPWDIVLLFGGGMALAGSLEKVGLIEKTTQFFSTLDLSSPFFLVLAIASLSILMTEIMSNVAFCVVALPMIMKLGESQGIDPILIALPATICASFAFCMPVSTPPNAVVFGTNTISVQQMLKAGVFLNTIAVALTMSLGYILIKVLLV